MRRIDRSPPPRDDIDDDADADDTRRRRNSNIKLPGVYVGQASYALEPPPSSASRLVPKFVQRAASQLLAEVSRQSAASRGEPPVNC